MSKKVKTFSIDENIEICEYKNGFKVYFMPNNDINRVYVNLKVKYGSVDQLFSLNDKVYQTPAGIAHFLEHKLFEMKNHQDAAVVLNELGAEPNAFTTNSMTSYVFSTTSNVAQCLKILLDFVFEPYFNKKSIDKEVEIINQELNMYADDADIVLFMKLLNNMYEKNHIRDDIGGSKESIREIDKKLLDFCYSVFYNPENMVLFVAGNFDLKEIKNVIVKYENRENKTNINDVKRLYYFESEAVKKPYEEIKINSGIEKVCIGFKFDGNRIFSLKEMVSIKILNNLMFGSSSDFYEELLKKQIITENFSSNATIETGISHFIVEADTKNANAFIKKIKNFIKNIKIFKITDEDFLRLKNAYLGNFIFSLNNIENFVNSFLRYENKDINFFEIYKTILDLKLEDVYPLLNLFKNENCVIVKGVPK